MADQNQVLIGLVYGVEHSLSKESMEYELAEEIRRDEREACCAIVYAQCESDNVAQRTVDAIRARENK